MKRHSLLIVGDSISYMMYQALFMQLEEIGQPMGQLNYNHSNSLICDGDSRLGFIRNDQISYRFRKNKQIQNDWWSYVPFYDILLLNKGAHVMQRDNFTEYTIETIEFLQKSAAKKHIFYRTTPQGHPNCKMHMTPDLNPISRPPKYLKKGDTIFLWHVFPDRDAYATQMFKRHLNATILEVVPMTSLRPDGHRVIYSSDCLHYFLPGPVDMWVYVFYNLLDIRLRSRKKHAMVSKRKYTSPHRFG